MLGLSALKSGMISQLFRRPPKFGYVGDTSGFNADRNPVVHSINARISHDPVITISCGADDAYVWYE